MTPSSNKKLRSQIVSRIAKLANDPRPSGCVRLSGREAYRIRQGDFRIVYTIEDEVLVVVVVRVGYR
ncbi:MAG TPA: type II toxin-antitoxin system RelE/ParE family toxin [Rhodothermales bacterium]